MSKKLRRTFSAEFKAQVGLDALKGIEPIQALASKHQLHPVQISQWKKEVLTRLPELFSTKSARDAEEQTRREDLLFQKIGRLEMELEWLKKKSAQLHG
jgi:transposase-like protein